jgi:hypothetical protein
MFLVECCVDVTMVFVYIGFLLDSAFYYIMFVSNWNNILPCFTLQEGALYAEQIGYLFKCG